MRKNLIAFVAALGLVLMGWGTAMAATSALQNVPGGGGFAYFHTSAAGDETLFNVQNVDATPILIHISIWDSNSDHVLDFNIPLSGWDNWGCSIAGDGTNITITPQTPCYYSGAGDGCFAPITVNLPEDADTGMQIGYISYVISAGDSFWYGGDGNGDPRNDPIITLASIRTWDVIFARVALLNPLAGSAIAMNGNNLQGFVNMYSAPGLDEAIAGIDGGWDSILDVGVPFFYNGDADAVDTFVTRDDPAHGLNIDSWEILLTNWATWSLITDDFVAPVGIGETLYNAVGSATQLYVARFNESPAIPSNTVLVTLFPANSGTLPCASSPAAGYASRTMSVFCYDDNEWPISTPITSTEVDYIDFDPAGIVVPSTSGECKIYVDAPLVGFTYTEAGNFADIYPLIDVDKWINVADSFVWTGHILDPLTSEVIEIGIQETY